MRDLARIWINGWINPRPFPDRLREALGLRMDPVPLKHPDHGLTLKDAEGAALIQRVRRTVPGSRLDLWWAMSCWRSMATGCDAAVTLQFCLRSRNVNVTYTRA